MKQGFSQKTIEVNQGYAKKVRNKTIFEQKTINIKQDYDYKIKSLYTLKTLNFFLTESRFMSRTFFIKN
jgi:hypothetical protein